MTSQQDYQAIINGPSMQAPPGIAPSFVDPPNINVVCFVVFGIALAGALVAVSIRMYTKWVILRRYNWEDCVPILGTSFFTSFCIFNFILLIRGIGTHQWNIQVKNIGPLLHGMNTGDILYNFSTPLTRIGILRLYLRLLPPPKKTSPIFIVSWALIAAITIFYTITFFLQVFACTPRERYWDPMIPGHCINIGDLSVAMGTFNLFVDVVAIVLPQYEICKLELKPKTRVAIQGVFLLALGACVASSFRLYYGIRSIQTGDVSYNVTLSGMFAATENSLSTICCALPSFPQFFRAMSPQCCTGCGAEKSTTRKLNPNHISLPLPVQSNNYWNSSYDTLAPMNRTSSTRGDGQESVNTVEEKEFLDVKVWGEGRQSSILGSEDGYGDLEGQRRVEGKNIF